jgi:hypothetical protein
MASVLPCASSPTMGKTRNFSEWFFGPRDTLTGCVPHSSATFPPPPPPPPPSSLGGGGLFYERVSASI